MKINDLEFNADLYEILVELQKQLHINEINLLNKMKEGNTDIMVTCPYHSFGQEKRPSAGIRKEDGVFHCFACNETHSLPEVISHCFGKDEIGSFGWKWLLQNFGTVSVEERKDVELDFVRSGTSRIFNNNIQVGENERNSRCSEYNSEKYVSEEELDKYRYIHPYMFERRLIYDVIEKFDIGYDRTTETITFPVRNIRGDCLFIARRSVKIKWFNYPSDVEKPLYGIYELYQLEKFPSEVIVCESMIDALTCWVYGKYAVALNGLGTELQFQQLRDLPCRKLILATDNDKAGWSARARIKYNIKNKIITQYILPSNRKDINELSQEEFNNLKEIF